jgi:uncharacterized membrane protein YgdD (TMEM256/DUF423 family)
VVLGAFGAHALKQRLGPESATWWNTAVQYHFWHALALLATGLAAIQVESAWLRPAGALFVAGMVLFCGSLYALALGAPRSVGMLTPFGGLAFILGWLAFALAVARA